MANYIRIAKETMKITKDKKYTVGGKEICLPELDYEDVTVCSPEAGEKLVKEMHPENETPCQTDEGASNAEKMCRFSVTAEDSFQAARRYENPLVMNFANAHVPGGGFLLGATAQEEALCRCSTLYASISGAKAAEMYRYNNTTISSVESDYMLLSKVCVFRTPDCELSEEPFVAGIVTVPAPNRLGAAMLTPEKKIEETMVRRIRILTALAKEHGYRNLILGAWGCGAFHNSPEAVARYFKQVLVEERCGVYFDEICFAVYGREDGKNIRAFRKCFDGI